MTNNADHMEGDPLPVHVTRSMNRVPDLSALPTDIIALLKKPGRRLLGDIDIRIDAGGTWFHEGGKVSRKELVRLFARVLYRDDAGDFWMVTPTEAARIRVEDAPFVAVELVSDETSVLRFRTNTDDLVPLDDRHPIRVAINPETGEPRPYLTVRDRLEALMTRPVFYRLVEESEEISVNGVSVTGVWSSGIFFPLGESGPQKATR